MERTAIFPGSFDPFTRGHAALVDEALNLFDRVIIGIGNNTSKQGLLTVENRKRLIDDIYRGDERVEACIYTGLTGHQPPHLPRHHDRHAVHPLARGRHLVVDRARGAFVRPHRGRVHAHRNRY